MGFEGFEIGDQIVPTQRALAPLIEKAKNFSERQRILTAEYRITGVGPTMIGIQSPFCEKSMNISKTEALVVARRP